MKKIAIILGLLLCAQTAFAGGTMLLLNDGTNGSAAYPENGTYVSQDGQTAEGESGVSSKKTYRTKRVRFGTIKNDPNTYWNYGSVNFGSGFSSTGSGVKRY